MIKRLVLILLSAILIFSLTAVTFGASVDYTITTEYSLQQMRNIAINALSRDFFMTADSGSWNGVRIIKETPLYNLDGTLTAYCFDLICDQQQAYIIISANSAKYPIVQFAPHGVSAYYVAAGTEKHFMYTGLGGYYVQQSDTQLMNLNTSEVLTYSTDAAVAASETARVSEDYYDVADVYINGTKRAVSADNYEYQNLIDVPLYDWYLGCAPTATAMALDYLYDGLYDTSSETISVLADLMGTFSGGTTFYSRMPAACETAITEAGHTYSSIAFPDVNLLNIPKTGPTYNTLADYKLSILDNRPVVITMMHATGTSGMYPQGFGNHVITGVGYTRIPAGDYPEDSLQAGTYLIVHTTYINDGDVFVPVEGTALGDYSWLFVDP